MNSEHKAPLRLQELKEKLDIWRTTIQELSDAKDAELIASNEAIQATLRANRQCSKELDVNELIQTLIPRLEKWPDAAHAEPEKFAAELPEGFTYIGGKADHWHDGDYVRNDFMLLDRKYSFRLSTTRRLGRIEILERVGEEVRTIFASTLIGGGRRAHSFWTVREVTQIVLGDWIPNFCLLLELFDAQARHGEREKEAARLRGLMNGGSL